MPKLHIVSSLHFAPSPQVGGKLIGFEEADSCIVVWVGVGAGPALVGQLTPSAAYFVLTQPVSSHSRPSITSFLLPLGLLWVLENASIMRSMQPGGWCSISMPGAMNSKNRKYLQERIVFEYVTDVHGHLLASFRVLDHSFKTTGARRCLPTSCVVVVRLAAHGFE
jgi:hypothetical protein